MSDLLAMSFDMATSPALTLRAWQHPQHDESGTDRPFGWGMGWYPGDEPAAVVVKDPTSVGDSAMARVLRDWERFRSSTFLCHLRGAAQRVTQRDTHPFIRSHGGRQWLIAHNGSLKGDLAASLPLPSDPAYQPIGRTDTEHLFCWLLSQFSADGVRRLAECGWPRLNALLDQVNALGTLNLLLTDGESLVVHRDQHGFNELHWVRLPPPGLQQPLENDVVQVAVDGFRDATHTGLLFSTQPLGAEGWIKMAPGQTLVARRASIIWDSLAVWGRVEVDLAEPAPGPAAAPPAGDGTAEPRQEGVGAEPESATEAEPAPGWTGGQPSQLPRPAAYSVVVAGRTASTAPTRGQVLSVAHETVYRYAAPVETSWHLLRLRPIFDAYQIVREHTLELSVDGLRREYEDVFGNHVLRLELATPYTELAIRTRSLVEVLTRPGLDLHAPERRHQIPLVWMPWQRQMMLPYLLPAELAESELNELHDFAMSFVERNDYELLDTLLDMNRTIFQDFVYIAGSTTLQTTPYEVFASRRGVCQDFANLLICLARLLNVPARYRAGYIYTGGNYENKMQSDASHAWVELYLPWLGWHGFDPTNGCLVAADHVRVACGRNYQDATPTSGTIYRGGGGESLDVNVRVEAVQ